jgi:hypothetical protein
MMLKQKQGIYKLSEKQLNEELGGLFRQETANFFDRKSYFDFHNFELSRLDIDLL